LVDAQGKSAITRSVAGGGDLIEQRTLNFNSMRRQECSRLSPEIFGVVSEIHKR
jgi:hypothetical protein